MTGSRLLDWLEDMRTAIRSALSYVEAMDKDAFLADPRTQQAVSMNLLIIGEAVAKLIEHYPSVLDQHPAVPWASIKGMRNRIAHGYFEIDLDVVWQTVQHSLPALLADLQSVIESAAGAADPHRDETTGH
jgi:uncharacterized protein with HEPN domain